MSNSNRGCTPWSIENILGQAAKLFRVGPNTTRFILKKISDDEWEAMAEVWAESFILRSGKTADEACDNLCASINKELKERRRREEPKWRSKSTGEIIDSVRAEEMIIENQKYEGMFNEPRTTEYFMTILGYEKIESSK